MPRLLLDAIPPLLKQVDRCTDPVWLLGIRPFGVDKNSYILNAPRCVLSLIHSEMRDI